MTTESIQNSLERIASLIRSETRQALANAGLQPVHFEALHYLARCNRYSDTPMGVTDFLGQTKGTVSQTLKVLERKEFIRKIPDAEDRRVVHLALTSQGRALVEEVLPSALLTQALPQLPANRREMLQEGLIDLLTHLQRANGLRRFGQCSTCVHNRPLGKGSHLCNLTGETLSDADLNLICREFSEG